MRNELGNSDPKLADSQLVDSHTTQIEISLVTGTTEYFYKIQKDSNSK
jgi:hypothetical protein